MKSTRSSPNSAPLRPLLQAGFAAAGVALLLRAAHIADFERGVNALPSLCLFHRLTGIDCPGCGMTRAFLRLAHGDLAGARQMHPFSIPLILTMLALAFLPEDLIVQVISLRATRCISILFVAMVLSWWCYFKVILHLCW